MTIRWCLQGVHLGGNCRNKRVTVLRYDKARLALPKALLASLALHLLALNVFWQREYRFLDSLTGGSSSKTMHVSFRDRRSTSVEDGKQREFLSLNSVGADGFLHKFTEGTQGKRLEPNKEALGGSESDEPNVYWAPDKLSVKPEALMEIFIPWPESSLVVGVRQEKLSVFVDEFGVVADVVPDGRQLTPAMLLAAKNAFLSAQFRPGKRNGRNVKSILRVLVVFESSRQVVEPVMIDTSR